MYSFRPGLRYLMPTHFGPSTGPRQGPDGRPFDFRAFETQSFAMSTAADPDALERLIPPRFALAAPVVGVSFTYYDRIPWLAGRGYNVLGVSVPVTFSGRDGAVDGDLVLVLWENMTEPIITGREELGVAKIYAEIPPPQIHDGGAVCRASWDGCPFARLSYTPDPSATDVPTAATGSTGARPWLHLKYLPSTAEVGRADVDCVTMTPPARDGVSTLVDASAGHASIEFASVTWEQMPTQFMIVNALHGLGLGEGPATMTRAVGAEDVSRQTELA